MVECLKGFAFCRVEQWLNYSRFWLFKSWEIDSVLKCSFKKNGNLFYIRLLFKRPNLV